MREPALGREEKENPLTGQRLGESWARLQTFGRLSDCRIATAAAMDTHNSFDAPTGLRPAPFRAAAGADGKLVVDLPAKSVVVLAVE